MNCGKPSASPSGWHKPTSWRSRNCDFLPPQRSSSETSTLLTVGFPVLTFSIRARCRPFHPPANSWTTLLPGVGVTNGDLLVTRSARGGRGVTTFQCDGQCFTTLRVPSRKQHYQHYRHQHYRHPSLAYESAHFQPAQVFRPVASRGQHPHM